ncbi:transcriptional regulator domain-containing protein [Mesorhizobium sp. 131-2-1]|uniref:transcriptional regulator domain-containing protein n=1 Tax=Mesorhizobium sp. 131-2-1 TaxID=2744518 RepID=UPI001938A023|nr:DUF6499 domain-containing protein [Mesorhizobium sp. 131-2-1]BCG96969.1 hypothetical protein MesoLj131a_58330 [Mesorhizobium sp. 131-2-1]
MKPNTSDWRDNKGYDFFDRLPIEGLAWECLRRSQSYRRHYQHLVVAGAEEEPLPAEEQRRWGLRFPGHARQVSLGARRLLVASGRSRGTGSQLGARPPISRIRGARELREAS